MEEKLLPQPSLFVLSMMRWSFNNNFCLYRGGFIKPTDGKPAYGGRGFYPGQPLKPSSSSSNDFRNSGMIPGKGPPQLHPSTSSSLSSGTSHHSSSSSSSGRSSGTHEFSGCGGSSNSSSKMHQSQRTLNKLHCEVKTHYEWNYDYLLIIIGD